MLVYGLVRAPRRVGFDPDHRDLSGSAILLIAFVINELRSRNPLCPSQSPGQGTGSGRPTQLIAFCGFFSMFFYATLYMQEILHYSPLKVRRRLSSDHRRVRIAGGLASQLVTRIGTRPIVVAGCLVAAAGIYWVSRVPLHGSYVTDILPGFVVCPSEPARCSSRSPSSKRRSAGDKAGLAAGLLNSSQQVGSASGLPSFRRCDHPHRQPGRLGHVTCRGLRRWVPPRPPGWRRHDGRRCSDRPADSSNTRGRSTGHGQLGDRTRAGVRNRMDWTADPGPAAIVAK